jgi:hypothetical protein
VFLDPAAGVHVSVRLTPYFLLAVLVLGTGLGIGLGMSEAPIGVGHGLSDRLELTSTYVVADRQIKGRLVIENGGSSFGITGRNHCVPGFAVGLANKHYQQEIAFDEDCEGITRMPFTIRTIYATCRPIDTGGRSHPKCLIAWPTTSFRRSRPGGTSPTWHGLTL